MRYKVRIINGVLNYLLASLLITAPLFVSVGEGLAGNLVMVIFGLASLTVGLVSDFELSVIKSIKYKDSLIANIVLGALLTISPFILDFGNTFYTPHAFLGTLQILLPFVSYRIHFTRKRTLQASFR